MIYPNHFKKAFEKGKAEGRVEVIEELLAHDTIVSMGAGSKILTMLETSAGMQPIDWEAKEPGYLCFIPIKMKDKPE